MECIERAKGLVTVAAPINSLHARTRLCNPDAQELIIPPWRLLPKIISQNPILAEPVEILLIATIRSPCSGGAKTWRYAMREEFTSYSFLAMTIAGFMLLCSSLLVFAFN